MERAIAVVALALAAALGLAGGAVGVGPTRDLMYAISAVGLVVACVVLAARWHARGATLRSTGFLVLAIGEALVLSAGNATSDRGAFAGATLLYAPALVLIGVESGLALVTRLAGLAAAIPFAAHGLSYKLGLDPDPVGTFAGIGYALLTLAVVGWIVDALRSSPDQAFSPRNASG